jgi:hypothetical protein
MVVYMWESELSSIDHQGSKYSNICRALALIGIHHVYMLHMFWTRQHGRRPLARVGAHIS